MKKKTDLKLLFETMGIFRLTLLASILFAAFSAVLNIYAYTYVYRIAEEVIANAEMPVDVDAVLVKEMGKGLLTCICSAFGLYGLSLLFSHITAFNTAARLKIRLIRHIGRLPAGFFDENSSGALRKLIEKNTDTPEQLIAHQIPNTTQSLVLPVVFMMFMFRYSVPMAIACIVPIIVGFLLLISIMAGNGGEFVKKYQQSSADISNAAVEYVRGIPIMKTFGRGAENFKRYKDATDTFVKYTSDFAMSMITADSSYNTAINATFFTLVPTALFIFKKTHQPSVIISFVFFASLIPMAVTMLKRIMSNSSETIIVSEALERLEELLEEKPMEFGGDSRPEHYDIRFDHVKFRYTVDGPDVLHDIDFEIPEGSITALVGMSGGGKSTIAALAGRMRDVTGGRVLIGATDIRDIPREVINKTISIVFQESTLLKTTIRENIALYKRDASENEIMNALEAARCMDIIERLPEGIDTVYGVEGTYFSGGEIQRLAIARAILADAPIVILDEATAFADSENEYLIRMALKSLLKGKTVIMIAHRITTVRDADRIMVIENGRIVEDGTHEYLTALGGRYRAMADEYQSAVNWQIKAVV